MAIRIPYDKTWKSMVTEYFFHFLKMLLPDLFKEIDLNIPPKFLEQELQAAITDKTNKIADKLVQITLKDGTDKWVYVHIEFETVPTNAIGERMFRYYRHIHEKYGKEITAIVIYTGSNVPKNFDRYEHISFGTQISYSFNTYQVRLQNELDLIKNQNPFAIFILANLYIIQSKNDEQKRLSFKEKVYELAVERNYSGEKISKLLIFVLDFMRLENKFEESFDNYYYKSIKQQEMTAYKISENTKKLLEGSFEIYNGVSFEQMKAEKKELDAKLVKSILMLYKKAKMSIEEIAEELELESKFIHDILKAKKLIK